MGNDFLPPPLPRHRREGLRPPLRGLPLAPPPGARLPHPGRRDPDASRLEALVQAIGAQEQAVLEHKEEEERKFRNKRRTTNARFGRSSHGPSEEELELAEAAATEEYDRAFAARPAARRCGHKEGLGGRKDFKGRYYYEKMGLLPSDSKVLNRVLKSYVEGLLWCLAYYYKGCVSWDWFFPFHYGPFLSDLVDLNPIIANAAFERGEPCQPYAQLLCCLPPASADLLPRCYQQLMTSPASPLIEFYPKDFKVDMNGKRNPWEGVNLLPFIDTHRVPRPPSATAPRGSSPGSRSGATRGERSTPSSARASEDTLRSTNADFLPDVPLCRSTQRVLTRHGDTIVSAPFRPMILEGCRMPYPGFPSLGVLPVCGAAVEGLKLNCFGSESRYETMALRLVDTPRLPSAAAGAKVLLRSVFANWPMMQASGGHQRCQ